MNESTLKMVRFLPIVGALVLVVSCWWFFSNNHVSVLKFSTGSELGLYHSLAANLKGVIEAQHPDIRITLQQSAGSNQNIRRLDSGEAQIALVQNDARGGSAVRSIAGLYPEVLHLVSRKDAGIHSLVDLPNKNIGLGSSGSGTAQFATALLSFAGITDEGGCFQHHSFSVAVDKLETGELDAAFFLLGLGSAVIPEAWERGELALVPIAMQPRKDRSASDIAQVFTDGLRVHYPNISAATIPMMAYAGRPAMPVPAVSVQAVLVCNEDLDSNIVEQITKIIFDQRAVLSQKNAAFSSLDETNAQEKLQFPLHEGAEHYYRRREPGFLAEHAESMGFILTAMLLSWSLIAWGQRWYAQRKKNRIDKYYQEINGVIARLNTIMDIKDIDKLEIELNHIRQQASDELVDEKLAANDAFIIYQNMLNGCQATLLQLREKKLGAVRKLK